MITAYTKRKAEDKRFHVLSNQIMAMQIVELFSVALDKSKTSETTPIWDYYPSLFVEEKRLHEKLHEQDEMEQLKARRKQFARAHNAKIGGDAD